MIDFYNAFISYRHSPLDSKVAEDVQRSLEHFSIPSAIRKRTGRKRIERIFRDKDELPITSDLTETISNALEKAEYLIVICSPNTKESMWVKREIQFFLKNHTKNQILTVLAGGEPQDVIPDELKNDERMVENELGMKYAVKVPIEPLSCDYRMPFKRAHKEELPRLASALIGCSYDELVRRQRQYRMRRMGILFSAILAVILAFGGYMMYSKIRLDRSYKETLMSQSRYLANESIRLFDKEERISALQLALASLPASDDDDRPVIPESIKALTVATLAYKQLDGAGIDSVWDYQMQNEVADFVLSADRKYLAGRDKVNNIIVWRVEDHQQVMNGMENDITDMAFLGDNSLMVLGTKNATVYSIPDGSKKWSYDTGVNRFSTDVNIIEMPDGSVMLSVANSDTLGDDLYIFDPGTGDIKDVINYDEGSIVGPRFYKHIISPDGSKLAATVYDPDGNGYKAGLFDLKTKKWTYTEVLPNRIADMAWADNDHIVTASPVTDTGTSMIYSGRTILMEDHNTITCYDASSLAKRWEHDMTSTGVMVNSSFLPLPGQNAVSYYHADTAVILNISTGAVIHEGHVYSPIIDSSDVDGNGVPIYITRGGGLATPLSTATDAYAYLDEFAENITKAEVGGGVYITVKEGHRILFYNTGVCDDEWQPFDDQNGFTLFPEEYKINGSTLAILQENGSESDLLIYDIGKCEYIKTIPVFAENDILDSSSVAGIDGNNVYVVRTHEHELHLYTVSIDSGSVDDKVLMSGNSYYDVQLSVRYANNNLAYVDDGDGKVSISLYNITDERKHSCELDFKPSNDCELFYLPASGLIYLNDRTGYYVINIEGETVKPLDYEHDDANPPCVVENGDGTRIAFGKLNSVYIMNSQGETVKTLPGSGMNVISMAFHKFKDKDYETLVVYYDNGKIFRYNADTGDIEGSSETTIYTNVAAKANMEFHDESGMLYITRKGSLSIVETDRWIEYAFIESCLGYAKESDRFITMSYESEEKYKMGYFKHYTLEDLKAKAEKILQGEEMSEEMKRQYGLI